MICTDQIEVVAPSSPFSTVEIEVPENSFPVKISTSDSVEVIATPSVGSAEVTFPEPLASEVLVLVAKGDPGEPGESGEDGRSAYQVAVDNGFVGSEAAWLASLEGEPGSPGDDGTPGLVAIHKTLAEYEALTVEEQNNPLVWWVIPKP